VAYHSRRRSHGNQRLGAVEIACIVAVVLAIAALVVWVITQAGGGHMLT
jgi:hypothetical protein